MNLTDDQHLARILQTFDIEGLGDGDPSTGLNAFAAMLVALANLARPGSGIRTPDGRTLAIGCDILATGPLVANTILDAVVAPVGRCQDNLLAQLDRLLKDDKAEEDRKLRNVRRKWTLSEGSSTSSGERSLRSLMTEDPNMGPILGNYVDYWREVVTSAPSARLVDLVRCPRIFITAPTAGFLEQQLADAHLGRALVAVGINRGVDAERFGDLCPALMDGMIPGGPLGESIGARLLVTDTGGILRDAAVADGDKTAWLARLLWLGENGAGPELPPGPADDNIVRLRHLSVRFERAVRGLFAKRLNGQDPRPLIYDHDFADPQARWMKFLAGMERSVPGISGTARRLPASLLFGLRRLERAAKKPAGFQFHLADIEALARFLVHRMANERAAIRFSAEEALKLSRRRRILAALADGRMESRDIYRSLHISAAPCHELLAQLEAEALIKARGREWERIEGASPPANRPPLEV